MQASWNKWMKVSGLMCDKRVSCRMKGNVRDMLRDEGSKIKRQEAELKMLRFSLRVTRMNRMRTKDIRGTLKLELLGMRPRKRLKRRFVDVAGGHEGSGRG